MVSVAIIGGSCLLVGGTIVGLGYGAYLLGGKAREKVTKPIYNKSDAMLFEARMSTYLYAEQKLNSFLESCTKFGNLVSSLTEKMGNSITNTVSTMYNAPNTKEGVNDLKARRREQVQETIKERNEQREAKKHTPKF